MRRRRQRELMLAGAVGGLVMFALSALSLLLLTALSSR